MSYQDEAGALAEQTQQQVIAALTAYLAGTLTAEAMVAVVAAYVAAANSAGAALGDLALSAAVTLATGRPAAPLGIARPLDDADRLAKGAQTILADLEFTESRETEQTPELALSKAQNRFQRLVEAEIRQATADAYSEAIKASPDVTGWVRGLEPDACQLCTWWWRDGRVWPADHRIPRHTGCDCSQIIVTKEGTPA